jgi:hypothetical protein
MRFAVCVAWSFFPGARGVWRRTARSGCATTTKARRQENVCPTLARLVGVLVGGLAAAVLFAGL